MQTWRHDTEDRDFEMQKYGNLDEQIGRKIAMSRNADLKV